KLTALEEHLEAAESFVEEHGPLLSGGLDDAIDCAEDTLEPRELDRELLASCGGKAVVARAAIARGDTPLRRNPAVDQHALQRWVQRAFFHLKNVLGTLLDGICHLVAMQRAIKREGLQNKQVERSRRDLVASHQRHLNLKNCIVCLCQQTITALDRLCQLSVKLSRPIPISTGSRLMGRSGYFPSDI